MTHEQIQALRAAAEKAIADDWGYDRDEFSEIASPAAILSLLAERDADKALIAEQAKRIAELEQRHCGGALMEREEHHVGVVNKLLERIAELEARTLTVKLPRDITHVTNKYFEEGRDAVLEAIESQLAAAGITLVVGE
ncbi:hypothetical protein AAIG33_20605 [Phytobacter ursingii]|uniref:hypothetical protein n=1 Tax=Phytobacter ursingii TaxID=1972431 RepID=UPI0031B7BDF6